MINLLVAYYENIWPFKDTCCSLIFDEWKYLIKAPIGSWKSFLFFDAPRYALYKDSSRNMLNLQSKNWEISLIFDVDWIYYLVKRILKSTRLWNDSCTSQLFAINYDWEDLLKWIKNFTWSNDILLWWENIVWEFESQNKKLWDLEEISFKNETDLQASLESLLPPKEVFLSTVFLLQDADNIFEMKPSDRLIVLKNVFNLLWIDDAKEKVQEKKKEVWYKLKALQDHSLQDSKLRTNLKLLWSNLKSLEEDIELKSILSGNDDFFYDIEWFFDQISLNDFSLTWLDYSPFEKAENLIHTKMDAVIKLDAQLGEFNQQILALNQLKSQILRDVQMAKINISDLQKKIENIDAKKWNELKEKKMELYHKSDSLSSNAKYSDFSGLIEFWNKAAANDDSFEGLEMPKDLKSAFDVLQIVKNAWISLRALIESGKTKLENIDLQAKNWKENHDREIEKMKDLKFRKEDEIKLQQTRIEELDKMWAENSDFDCPDLCKKCPHINAINKQQYEQYSQQKEKLNQTLETIKSEYEKQNFDNKIKELENQKNPEWWDLKKDLEEKIKGQTEFSDSLREYLMKIWFVEWEKSYREWESIQGEIQSVDKQLFQREEESKNLEKYQQDKVAVETSLQHLEKSLKEQDSQIEELNVKIEWVNAEKEKLNRQKLQQQQNEIKQIFQTVSQIEQLVEDSINNKNLAKQLQEEEKKLGRLYSILSKEIVFLALDDYLPVLSDVINNYLSQCVDYTLKMQIDENADKLELNVKVIDSKWEREVKSLSGWQRTVLKLVWMLAVSSYLHTPLLFLDETINNLDVDTVWKVSEMINNFVKQRTMKFYTVTHNKEIQDMQIWDDVIEIASI